MTHLFKIYIKINSFKTKKRTISLHTPTKINSGAKNYAQPAKLAKLMC